MITSLNEYKLTLESFLPGLRIGQEPLNLDYKNIELSDIELIEAEDDGKSIINLDVVINGTIEPGIALDIQIINGDLYHPHINIHQKLRGQGLATKIYQKFIQEFGLIYTSTGRRLNNLEIKKIYDKFELDSNIIKIDTYIQGGKIYILRSNPNLEHYIQKYSK